MQYYLGIDGGGTKTRLIISDENLNKIALYQGDSINIYSVGKEKSFIALKTLIDLSLKEQQIQIKNIKRICIASAGLAREDELKDFTNFFSTNYPTLETIFTTDIKALVVGALKEEDGICLIAGTGSVAMGQDINKSLIRAGGLGWRLGDEGSASFIAQEAIKRSFKSIEGRDFKTNMMESLLAFYKLEKPEDLIQFFHNPSLDKASIAAFASIVTEFGRKGDLLALDILRVSAKELLKLVISVNTRLINVPSRILVTAGGVFEHDEILNNFFNEELEKYNIENKSEIKRVLNKTNALNGALYLAKNT